jgi:hypothetical protein
MQLNVGRNLRPSCKLCLQRIWTKNLGVVWFTKCNVKGNGNGLHSITGGNKFE